MHQQIIKKEKHQSLLCSSQQVTGCPPVWQVSLPQAAWGEQLGKEERCITQSRKIKRYDTAMKEQGHSMGNYFKRRVLLGLNKGVSSLLPASTVAKADSPWKSANKSSLLTETSAAGISQHQYVVPTCLIDLPSTKFFISLLGLSLYLVTRNPIFA